MKFQNGYKIIYEAKDRISEEKPGQFYASKDIPAADDTMLISYDNSGNYVDMSQFKLLYSDSAHLFGSMENIPTDGDTNIVIKAGEEVVLGEIIG